LARFLDNAPRGSNSSTRVPRAPESDFSSPRAEEVSSKRVVRATRWRAWRPSMGATPTGPTPDAAAQRTINAAASGLITSPDPSTHSAHLVP